MESLSVWQIGVTVVGGMDYCTPQAGVLGIGVHGPGKMVPDGGIG